MLRQVFIEEGRRHPILEPQDLLKLLYQHVYGGEHLVVDWLDSLKKLRQEWSGLSHKSGDKCFYDIGNGFVRLSLNAVETEEELLGVSRIFTAKSFDQSGREESFLEGVKLLVFLAETGEIPIDKRVMVKAVDDYLLEGIRPIRHSEAYRSAYRPAYRVVRKDLTALLPIITKIEEALIAQKPIIIGIDGPAGSGKTTITTTLESLYDMAVIPLDHFFLPLNMRTEKRMREPGGNIDYDRFFKEVVEPLKTTGKANYRIFDCAAMDFVGGVSVPESSIVICEGSYSLHPKFRDFYDLQVFVSCGKERQQQRIFQRNNPETYSRYIAEWIPMEERYFREFNVENGCDIIIDTNSF